MKTIFIILIIFFKSIVTYAETEFRVEINSKVDYIVELFFYENEGSEEPYKYKSAVVRDEDYKYTGILQRYNLVVVSANKLDSSRNETPDKILIWVSVDNHMFAVSEYRKATCTLFNYDQD